MKRAYSKIGDIMHLRHETIAVAESATSGCLQNIFSRTTKAAEYYLGGMTAYVPEQKIQLLEVDVEEAAKSFCVSEKIAEQMASGVAKLFSSDWGIGFTGYASPVPSLDIEKLYGYYAVSYKKEIVLQDMIFSKEKYMKGVQEDYAEQIFKAFFSMLIK